MCDKMSQKKRTAICRAKAWNDARLAAKPCATKSPLKFHPAPPQPKETAKKPSKTSKKTSGSKKRHTMKEKKACLADVIVARTGKKTPTKEEKAAALLRAATWAHERYKQGKVVER